jgi:hypothetical protein
VAITIATAASVVAANP